MSDLNRVVAHFTDGRLAKGTTQDFFPNRPRFHVQPADGGAAIEIRCRDLKALFFVRDFEGDSRRQDRQDFDNQPLGRAVAVTFFDGEVLVGASWTHEAARDGFFLFPADPHSNNLRVYVIAGSVASVEKLAPGGSPSVSAPA